MSTIKIIKTAIVCIILVSIFVAGGYSSAANIPLTSKEVSDRTLYQINANGITAFRCETDHKASWNSIPIKNDTPKFDVSGDWQITKDGSLILRYKSGIHLISVISKDTSEQFWTVLTDESEKTRASTRVYFTLTNAINHMKYNH